MGGTRVGPSKEGQDSLCRGPAEPSQEGSVPAEGLVVDSPQEEVGVRGLITVRGVS